MNSPESFARSGDHPGPPETLGRRSPIYHPYLYILIAVLVLIVQIRSWMSVPRDQTSALALDQEYILVSRGRTPETGGEVVLRDHSSRTVILRRSHQTKTEVQPEFYSAWTRDAKGRILAGDSAGLAEFGAKTFDSKEGAAPTPELELKQIISAPIPEWQVLALESIEDRPEVFALAADREMNKTTLLFARLSLSDWATSSVHQLSGDRRVLTGLVIPGPNQERRVLWVEVDGSRGFEIKTSRRAAATWTEPVVLVQDDEALISASADYLPGVGGGLVFLSLEMDDRTIGQEWRLVHRGDQVGLENRVLHEQSWSGSAAVSFLSSNEGGDGGLYWIGANEAAFAPLVTSHEVPALDKFEAIEVGHGTPRTIDDIERWFALLALSALIAGTIESFRRPVFSEPPMLGAPAAFFRRGVALFMDSMACALIAGLLGGSASLSDVLGPSDGAFDARVTTTIQKWFAPSEWKVWIIYYSIMTVFLAGLECRFGRTLGKWMMGIRVIGENEAVPPSFFRCLLRRAILYIDLVSFTFVFAFLNSKGQRLGDMVSRTQVVRDPDPAAIEPSEKTARSSESNDSE